MIMLTDIYQVFISKTSQVKIGHPFLKRIKNRTPRERKESRRSLEINADRELAEDSEQLSWYERTVVCLLN